MIPKKIFILATLAICVGTAAWIFHSNPKAQAEGGMGGFSVPVEAVKLEAAPLDETVQSVGTLVAEQGVMLRPEIAGVIAEILFTEGQTVKAGQPLFRLEDSVQKAELALAQRTNNRATNLAGRGAGTAQAADQSNATLQVAQAAFDKTLITAPFDGTVGIRQVNKGDYVKPGQDLVTVQNLSALKFDFRVPETLLARVAVGQKITLHVDAYPDKTFTGEVVAIDPLVDAVGRSVSLRARVPNTDGTLRPGLFASALLSVGEQTQAVFVPATALTPMGGQNFIFKIVDGKATLTPVQMGLRQSEKVQIVSGASAGDEVVTSGQVKLMMMGGAQHPMPVMVLPTGSDQNTKDKP